MPTHRRSAAMLLGVASILFLANIWGYDLWPPDEPRFGEVAREMLVSGDYLAPHVNGEPYKEKPPLLFWSIAAVSAPFGDVSEATARIPSAAAALIAVLFTFLLARKLYGEATAWWAGIMLATASLFWWEARSVRTDMILTAAMTVSLWAFYGWHTQRTPKYLLAFYGAIAAGLFAKGPPALVFPLLLIITFYWRRKAERKGLLLIPGLAAAILLVLAWFIPARMALPSETAAAAGIGNEAFRQIIGRAILGVSKAQPPWYYVINLPVNLLPWALFLPWTLPWVWQRRREDDRMRLLLAWTIPTFIFFSIVIGKRAVYLLPMYPALAILLARSILDLMGSERLTWRRRTALVWTGILLALGAAPFGMLLSGHREYWSWTLIPFGVAALACSLATFVHAQTTEVRRLHHYVAGSLALLALLGAFLVLPVVNNHKGAKDFCAPVRQLAEKGVEFDLYSVGFSREEFIFYAKHFHTPILNDLIPVDDAQGMDLMEVAKAQRHLRKAILAATEDVAVDKLTAATAGERQALSKAIHEAMASAAAEEDIPPAFCEAFEAGLRKAINGYAGQFHETGLALMFVQEEDWKWLIPLVPDLSGYHVLKRENVGSRSILLIANPAAAKLASQG